MKRTIITKIIKDQIYIDINHKNYQALIKGQFRIKDIKPTIGDYVQYQIIDNNQFLITDILARKNLLIRPRVANVDIVVIVQSTTIPNFDTLFLDKMISFYEQYNLEVIIAITKTDINYSDDIKQKINDYKKMKYHIFDVNDANEYKIFLSMLKEKVVCFIGNSGVGKSTLINKIAPELNLKTQSVSLALNRGKHTTTNTSLIFVKDFYLIDTPGYSTVDLKFVFNDKKDFAHIFFNRVLNNNYCKFNDCLHLENSTNCLIKELIEQGNLLKWRYQNYLVLLNNIEVKKSDKYKNSKFSRR